MLRTALFASLLTSLTAAHGQLAPAPFLLGGEHQLSSDLDGGGSFSRSSVRTRLSAPLFLGEDTIIGVSGSYRFDSFEFDDRTTEPWGDIHRARIGLIAKQDLANDWTWLALSYVGTNAESGADWGESLRYGGLGAAWYRYSDNLSIGLGAGFSTQLEDDLSVFPILVLDWQITDTLTLSTIPPEGFNLGPGATLRWDLRDDLSLSLVYLYQRDQQRLDEDSLAAANGVGETRQSRVALAATYRFSENFSLTGHLGMTIGGELELQNESGDTLTEEDYDSSLVFGLEGSLRF
ncbi:DUF6268 family outer membrane beta-barrel protein [Roseibacillus persicicus]|nr:DUF6268 family outer membrane beta-barrel protein [Roseibacillus persicicus]MDQ8191514.1 DUF6268 family outer membrane beta-barrel protein [Roseibacillus persicicus]